MTIGAIATPHASATEAGRKAFASGGNALDAALVAASVLTVVYPHQCAIGGDLFALVHKGQGDTYSVNGSGALPGAVDVDCLRSAYSDVPPSGPHSITTPGLVAGWNTISQIGGTFTAAEIVRPAFELAANGIEVSKSLATGIRAQAEVLQRDDGLRSLFLPSGVPAAVGTTIKQIALSRTFECLAIEGFDSFYRGQIGERLVRGLQGLGASISKEDMIGHETVTVPPLTYQFRGFDLMTSPPNSQGFALLQALAALDSIDVELDTLGDLSRYALCAALLAANDRDAHLCDPRHTNVPLTALFDSDALELRMRKLIAGGVQHWPSVSSFPSHGDTVAICAMDEQGNAISLIQSVYQTFGAGLLEAQTGTIMHNRARGFSLKRGVPNEMIPGMRPPHTLMPLLVMKDRRVVAALGTMGGRAQPQILMQILPGVLDTEASISAHLAAPRWVFGRHDIGFSELTVAIEADAPPHLDERLGITGIEVVRVGCQDERTGHTNVVRMSQENVLECASDPRSDGVGSICR